MNVYEALARLDVGGQMVEIGEQVELAEETAA